MPTAELPEHIDGLDLHRPGSAGYDDATAPRNTSGAQQPLAVVRPTGPDQVARVVQLAVRHGLRVTPQATGHGAAGHIGEDTVLVDTGGLDELTIDADARYARAGAGLTWGQVNAAAEPHGLLGRAGSSPSVGVAGYTFDGGLGWLVRPHGLASAHLRRVTYVDGAGAIRDASADAADEFDRDAFWTFCGGGGAGIATAVEFDLVAVPELWAGYLLWPGTALEAVADAWTAALPFVGAGLATCLSVIRAPGGPMFPDELAGRPVVALSMAGTGGPDEARPLLDGLNAVEEPALDTWGRADAARLGGIHLDPPVAVPSIGAGYWLDADGAGIAVDALGLARVDGGALQMVEMRHVANPDRGNDGALTVVGGDFLTHAVGEPGSGAESAALDDALEGYRAVVAGSIVGRPSASFADGRTSDVDDTGSEELRRRNRIRRAVDPARRIGTARGDGY